jgi:hypothetical protein
MLYNTFAITSRLSSGSELLYNPNSDLGEKKLRKVMKASYCIAAPGNTEFSIAMTFVHFGRRKKDSESESVWILVSCGYKS